MHRGRKARLDRLTRRTGEGDSAAIERHRMLRARAAIGAAVRWSLARQGIDPARVPALLIADDASAELAASGDPPPPCSAEPAAGDNGAADNPGSLFDDCILPLVARYRDGSRTEPDFARASLAELLAWCIADADHAGST